MQEQSIDYSLNFNPIIAEHTQNFVGREWVFQELDDWLKGPSASPFFFIVGEPGVGKTALSARLTQILDISGLWFCAARRSDTINPIYFTHTLAKQLSKIDGFARAVLERHHFHL